MDITNLNVKDSVAPVVVKLLGAAGTNTPTTPGNSLPELGQIHSPAENSQDRFSATQANSQALHALLDEANNALSARNSNLKFTVAEGTDIRVIRIEDTQTGELIRQIPSEQMVAISNALEEFQRGTMLQEKA
jgi:flagellar protein FlaG